MKARTNLNPSPVQVISFTDQNIKAWETELLSLDKKIKALTTILAADEKKMELLLAFNSKLAEKIAQRKIVIEAKVEAAQVKQKQQNSDNPVKTLIDAFKTLENEFKLDLLDEFKLQIKDGVKEFFDPLLRYYDQEQEIDCQIPLQILSEKMEREVTFSREITAKATGLVKQTLEAKVFLEKLRNEPETLINDTKKRITQLKTDYEQKYPTEQSDVVRTCLLEMDDKLKIILDNARDSKEQVDKKKQQKQFFELAGFLWRMFDLFLAIKNDLTNADRELANQIFAILKDMHINKEDDLSSEMALNKTCAELYRSEFKDISLSQLRLSESQRYIAALADLRSTLSSPQILPVIKQAADCIISEVEKCKHSDIKFATQILTATNDLIKPGGDTIVNLQNYFALANKAAGKPSYGKMVAGMLIGLAGLAIIGLSVFGAIASFGGVTPVSVFGVQFGVSLVSAAISYAVGLATMSIGTGFFASGTRKGLSEKAVNLGTIVQSAEPVKPEKVIVINPQKSNVNAAKPQYVPIHSGSPRFMTPPPAYSTLPAFDNITPVAASAPGLDA